MAPMAPTLSLVMANYNHAHYLRESLPLIFAQSRKADEVIVIDDCSTDDSLLVLEEFSRTEPTLRVIKNEVNRGANYCVNHGLEVCKGNYICFHSADDKIMPGFFEKNMSMLERYPQAGLCCSFGSNFNSKTGIVEEGRLPWSETARYFSPTELGRVDVGGAIPGHTSIYRKDAVIAAGGIMKELEWHSDWFMIHVVAARHGICFIPEVMALIRLTGESYSTGRNDWSKQREVVKRIINLTFSPEFQDVIPFFQSANIMSHSADDIHRLVIEEAFQFDPRMLGYLYKMLRPVQQERISNDLRTIVGTYTSLLNACVP